MPRNYFSCDLIGYDLKMLRFIIIALDLSFADMLRIGLGTDLFRISLSAILDDY